MKSVVTSIVIAVFATACGGGGSEPSRPMALVGVVTPSPGSHWFVKDAESNAFHLFISETGKLRAIFHLSGASTSNTFGAGSVSVSSGGQVSGTMQALGILPSPGSPGSVPLSCSLAGTVIERVKLDVTVSCSDNTQIQYNEFLTFSPEPGYDVGSSLAAIAGNYTLPIRRAGNTLSISADGTLFGMYDNDAQCILNGTVSIIDARYRFLDVEWSMSNCTDPFGLYEGTQMSGFAMPSPEPNDPPGNYYFLLTRSNSNTFSTISVMYERT